MNCKILGCSLQKSNASQPKPHAHIKGGGKVLYGLVWKMFFLVWHMPETFQLEPSKPAATEARTFFCCKYLLKLPGEEQRKLLRVSLRDRSSIQTELLYSQPSPWKEEGQQGQSCRARYVSQTSPRLLAQPASAPVLRQTWTKVIRMGLDALREQEEVNQKGSALFRSK